MFQALALEGFFQGGAIVDFSKVSQKHISRGAKVMKFHFSLS